MLAGWAPPFAYRIGDLPRRDIVTRVVFSVPNQQKTELAWRRHRGETLNIYTLDSIPTAELLTRLKLDFSRLLKIEDITVLEPRERDSFFEPAPNHTPKLDPSETLVRLKAIFAEDKSQNDFDRSVEQLFAPFIQQGLIQRVEHAAEDGSQLLIRVVSGDGSLENEQTVRVEDITITSVTPLLPTTLRVALEAAEFSVEDAELVSQLLANWVRAHPLPITLRLDPIATEKAYLALNSIQPELDLYPAGKRLAEAYLPLTRETVVLLKSEHAAWLERRHWLQTAGYTIASFGLYVAIFTLLFAYIRFHHPELIRDFRQFSSTLTLMVIVVGVTRLAAADAIRAELIPMLLFGMTIRVAFPRELSLLLTAVMTLLVVLGLGQSLGDFIIMIATVFSAVLMLGRIQTRTKLLYIGLGAATVGLLTTLGVGILTEQTYGIAGTWAWWQDPTSGMIDRFHYALRLISGASWYGFAAILAGLVMTGLLPFVEWLFDIQTDISLLELGDARHPLMQELARRAPGTFSHSLSVASLAEVAAEAIGANGLLVRVGSYFHDIGKMLNPHYFVENEGQDGNRHESLAPAMSTLVIIAHVKDGVNLARQYRLPQSIVDFIEQHHGTTIIEYFYQQATKNVEENPELSDIDDADFRYPGPKPKTREAAVLMIADSAESASRSLVDPAPARIQTLVHDLIMHKLNDDQFDECGVTMKDLTLIETSLVKSLTALYHGRIKYPSVHRA